MSISQRKKGGGPFSAALVVSATLISSACGSNGTNPGGNPTAPSPPPAGATINYTALGASDTMGYGSSVVCVPFTDCPNGTGYVQTATRQLNAQGYHAALTNLGIPTAVIGPDFQSLGQQYGRTIAGNLIEREMPFVRGTATVVSVFIGANDVDTITAALGGGAGGSDQAGYIDQKVSAFGSDFTTLLNGIRNNAAAARIIVLNLPNLGAMPYLARSPLAQRQAAQRASVKMTQTVINPLVSQGVTVVDLMCDPRAYSPANVSSDGFHPNDAGYAFMAADLVQAITSTSYPAPVSSCAQMTAIP